MARSLGEKCPTREVTRRDWVYAAHVYLCLTMLAWRMLEATPGVASTQNGAFAGSPLGLGLTVVTVWLGVGSLIAIAALTFAMRTDAKLWILFVSMFLSMLWRRDVDVFDITYVALVAVLAVWWFTAGRARMRSALASTSPMPARAA